MFFFFLLLNIFLVFFRFLFCLVFRLNLIYSHFFLFNSVALISPAHPRNLCVESALSTPIQLLKAAPEQQKFWVVSTKNDVSRALPSQLSMGSIPQSQDKGQGLRGTLGVALQEGDIWEFGAVAMLGTLPWFSGKIFSWGWNSRCSWKGGLGKDCIVVMDWEYPPPQPPHLLEPASAGKAGISSQNTSNKNK